MQSHRLTRQIKEILPIMPIGEIQKTDIRDEHRLGYFRICASFKDIKRQKGFDRFPHFAVNLFGKTLEHWNYHLIVQLRGCPLKCPFCYVDDEGLRILPPHNLPIKDLVLQAKSIIAKDKRLHVFHLMGGAPAMYVNSWDKILNIMNENKMSDIIFHSDIVLVEPDIVPGFFTSLRKTAKHPNHLIAICIKGINEKNLIENSGVKNLIYIKYINNLRKVIDTGINFYLTLVNPDINDLPVFLDYLIKEYGSGITNKIQLLQIKTYNVTKHRFQELYKQPDKVAEKLNNNFELAYKILSEYTNCR